MGEIVPFRAEKRPWSDTPPPGQSAQILFFLGVRYVRDDDETSGPKKRSSGGSQRPARRRKRA